jgi:hypothetical protein
MEIGLYCKSTVVYESGWTGLFWWVWAECVQNGVAVWRDGCTVQGAVVYGSGVGGLVLFW